MKRNIGTIDRLVRLVAGITLMTIGVVTGAWWGLLLGLLPIAAAGAGYCPPYALLGIDTARREHTPA